MLLPQPVFMKLCQGIPRSGDKNLIFYFILVSFGFANLIECVLEGSFLVWQTRYFRISSKYSAHNIVLRW